MTHGVCGYVHHGCRCEECTAAQRDRMRVYRARALETSGTLDTNQGPKTKRPRVAPTTGGMASKDGTP